MILLLLSTHHILTTTGCLKRLDPIDSCQYPAMTTCYFFDLRHCPSRLINKLDVNNIYAVLARPCCGDSLSILDVKYDKI